MAWFTILFQIKQIVLDDFTVSVGNQPETSRYLIASCSSIDFAFWKDFFAPNMYWYMVKLCCSSSQI